MIVSECVKEMCVRLLHSISFQDRYTINLLILFLGRDKRRTDKQTALATGFEDEFDVHIKFTALNSDNYYKFVIENKFLSRNKNVVRTPMFILPKHIKPTVSTLSLKSRYTNYDRYINELNNLDLKRYRFYYQNH